MATIKIPHSRPTLSEAEVKAVQEVLRCGYIAQGKKVEAFEQAFCRFLKIKNAAAVNSGTSALHAALMALGIKEKDEVIIPSYACCALLQAVLYVKAAPVVVDVNEEDFNLSLKAVHKSLTPRTKAIIIVHSFGLPVDIIPFKKFGVAVIEDCTHAIGARFKEKPVGSQGDISVFSFYATKMITTAEGGMIASNKPSFINRVRGLTSYDKQSTFKVRYNYKMSDVQAAIGIEQLKKVPAFIAERKKIASLYANSLRNSPFILPQDSVSKAHIYYRYIVRCPRSLRINKVLQAMNKQGIECARPIFKPLHTLWKSRECPVSGQLMQSAISLPIYPSMPRAHAQLVAKKILKSAG